METAVNDLGHAYASNLFYSDAPEPVIGEDEDDTDASPEKGRSR